MKPMIALLSVFTASSSFAAEYTNYLCKPPQSVVSDNPPADAGVPASFVVSIGAKASPTNPNFYLTINNKILKLNSNPFVKPSPNSKDFDRYTVVNSRPALIQKTAYAKPSSFNAKLEYDFDAYHGVPAWYPYNCKRITKE